MKVCIRIHLSANYEHCLYFLYTHQRWDILWDHPWCMGVQTGGRHPVLCAEHNFIILCPIHFKFDVSACHSITECSEQELYFMLSLSYFPLMVIFTTFSVCQEYSFVVLDLVCMVVEILHCPECKK